MRRIGSVAKLHLMVAAIGRIGQDHIFHGELLRTVNIDSRGRDVICVDAEALPIKAGKRIRSERGRLVEGGESVRLCCALFDCRLRSARAIDVDHGLPGRAHRGLSQANVRAISAGRSHLHRGPYSAIGYRSGSGHQAGRGDIESAIQSGRGAGIGHGVPYLRVRSRGHSGGDAC